MGAMVKHRFHVENLNPGQISLGREESRHAYTVLRLRPGALVDLFDGAGLVAEGVVSIASKSEVVVDVESLNQISGRKGASLILVTAMPRSHRQSFLFEKCTELGVAGVIPCLFERSTVRPKADSVEKWRRITIEAGKQSGAAYLPEVGRPVKFAESLNIAADADLRLVALPGHESKPLANVLQDYGRIDSVVVWIGPEGGLADDEAHMLIEAGVTPVSLGGQILRVETAGLAVAAVCASLLSGE